MRAPARLLRPVAGVTVSQDFVVDPGGDIGSSPETTPIIINNFNRLTYLKRLLAALESRGYTNVYVIDNCSTYEPLLRFYEESGLRVFRLSANVGYLSLWTTGVGEQFADGYYAYTDPDIEPAEECPADFIARFRDVLAAHPGVDKVGFGLRTDDIPATFDMRDAVIRHERGIVGRHADRAAYRAPIDTTLALYRPGAAGGYWLAAMRTGEPYVARHLPWYVDSARPDEEELHYRDTIATSTHWTLLGQREPSGTITVDLWGEPVRVVTNAFVAAHNMVWRPEWNPAAYDAIDSLIEDGRDYLELGSDLGQTALYAARRARHVYALECDFPKYTILARNVSLNGDTVRNVQAIGTCIARRPVPGRSTSWAGFEAAHRLDECGLVRVDMRGREYAALPQMVPFLRRVRPGLVLTMNPRRLLGLKGPGILARIAVGVTGLMSIAAAVWLLRFYRHVLDGSGGQIRLRDVPGMCRSTITLIFTDRRPREGA